MMELFQENRQRDNTVCFTVSKKLIKCDRITGTLRMEINNLFDRSLMRLIAGLLIFL
jgi:hypothetical protein